MKNTLTINFGFVAALAAGAALVAPVAAAQEAGYLAEFERPYGWDYGSEQRPYDANTRDLNGNRVIINGLIGGGTTLGQGLNTGWGQTYGSGMLGTGSAIGNQLNVVTNGNNNTVIIDSTQINNGDQYVVVEGDQGRDRDRGRGHHHPYSTSEGEH